MKNRDCSIVRDLLPLYVDDVISSDTKQFVDDHINECSDCKKELELSQRDISTKDTSQIRSTDIEVIKKMKKKLKHKNLIVGVIATIVACCLTIIIFNALTIPCVINAPQEEIEILRVYKFTDTKSVNDGDAFWVFGTKPVYNTPVLHDADIILSEDGTTGELVYSMKIPIVNERSDEIPYTTLNPKLTIYDDYKNIDTLYYDGEIIWTEDTGVPDYVYAKNDDDIVTWDYDMEQNVIRAEYKDGTFIIWDLDGNIVSEGNYNQTQG